MNTTNNVIGLAEAALQTNLLSAVSGTVVSGAVLLSDEDDVKPAMPYVIARAINIEEEISPGCGIFKVTCGVIFKSHAKATTPAQREAVVVALNNFAYTGPAAALSAATGFYCHGFVPTTGEMTVDPETKAYIYELQYMLHCMPTDN